MSTESETPKHEARSAPLDPFGTWRAAHDASLESLRSMRDTSLASWSKIMIDFVNSEAYSQATAQWLDAYLTVSQPFQQAVERAMTQVLTGLNMPTRGDVINLAARLTNIEIRLDDLDAKLDDIQRSVQTLSASKDDIQRAIQAFSTLKDASAAASASSTHTVPQGALSADVTAVSQSYDTQGEAPAHPVNDTTTSKARRSGGKQGKAKEAH